MKNAIINEIPGIVNVTDNYVELGYDVIVRPGIIAIEDGNMPGDVRIFETRQEAQTFMNRMREEGCCFYFLKNSTEEEFENAVAFANELISIDEPNGEDLEELDEYELLQDEFDTHH